MQYSGPSNEALSYVDWLRKDDRFFDILVQISPAPSGHAFPRLKLRYKPSLVQVSYMLLSLFPSLYRISFDLLMSFSWIQAVFSIKKGMPLSAFSIM